MRVSRSGLAEASMTQAQMDAQSNAAPWYVQPFIWLEDTAQSGYCFLNPSDPSCVTNTYTPAVATATAPGTPVGYDPTSGQVAPSNTTGATTIAGNYGAATGAALPAPSSGLSNLLPNLTNVPSWVWVAAAVVGGLIILEVTTGAVSSALPARRRKR